MCSEIYFSASPLYMFRAAHTPIIRSTILISLHIVASVGYSIEYYDAWNKKYKI